jgi:hypothetical protein
MSSYVPFGYADKPTEKHCWLICCERKYYSGWKNKLKRRIISRMNRTLVNWTANAMSQCLGFNGTAFFIIGKSEVFLAVFSSGFGAPKLEQYAINAHCSISFVFGKNYPNFD